MKRVTYWPQAFLGQFRSFHSVDQYFAVFDIIEGLIG